MIKKEGYIYRKIKRKVGNIKKKEKIKKEGKKVRKIDKKKKIER